MVPIAEVSVVACNISSRLASAGAVDDASSVVADLLSCYFQHAVDRPFHSMHILQSVELQIDVRHPRRAQVSQVYQS